MPRRFAPVLLLLLTGMLAGAAVRAALAQSQIDPFQTATGSVEVIEGDRVSVGGKRIRLYGIDAPDLRQTCENRRGESYDCGLVARDILGQITAGGEARCTLYARVPGNAYTGRCFVGETDIGEMIVRRGWAFSYRGLSHRYDQAEARAQAAHAGLWAGRAQRPWVWRQENPQPPPRNARR